MDKPEGNGLVNVVALQPKGVCMAYVVLHSHQSQAEERLLQFMANRCDQYWYYQMRHCVPQLIALLDQSGMLGDESLAEQAGNIIRENCPIQETGEPMSHRHRALELQIRLIIDELERLACPDHRPESVATHVPPQMFG